MQNDHSAALEYGECEADLLLCSEMSDAEPKSLIDCMSRPSHIQDKRALRHGNFSACLFQPKSILTDTCIVEDVAGFAGTGESTVR